MAWLSASLFLLPVMKLRVVRGMVVEGMGMGMRMVVGVLYWGLGRREGGWFDERCG